MMDLPRVCTLPFLAARPYLHGTTLFDAMLESVPADAAVSFKISRLIGSDRVRLELLGEERKEAFPASLLWSQDGAEQGIVARELPGTGTPERHPYDEAIVTGPAEITETAARFTGESPFTFIATVVPLFKAMLERGLAPVGPGQWMFTRFDADFVPNEAGPIALGLDAAVPGRLARCRVAAADTPVGTLYFSWVRR